MGWLPGPQRPNSWGWYPGNRKEGLRVFLFLGIWPGILPAIRPQYTHSIYRGILLRQRDLHSRTRPEIYGIPGPYRMLQEGSRVSYCGGSHEQFLPTTEGRRFLNEISQSALDEVGCQCEEKTFPDGGLTIFDARIGFELKEGYAITFEFATADVIKNGIKTWPKMVLPSSPELIQKVGDMERDLEKRKFQKIRMNFVFRDPIASTNT